MIVMAISSVTAIKITEFESNPTGNDAGKEWVELYSEEEISLDGYFLENNDEQTMNLSGNFSGYKIITLQGQWLDNSDEKVFLKSSEGVIFETDLLDDSDNNDKTWNLCGENWQFIESSKGEENNCENSNNEDEEQEEQEEQPEEPEESDDEEPEEVNEPEEQEEIEWPTEKTAEKTETKTEIKKENEKITLESPEIEVKIYSSNSKLIRYGMVSSFALLLILITILLFLRKL